MSLLPAARVGDIAGGPITFSPQAVVLANGIPLAVVGSTIANHGKDAHAAASLLIGVPYVRINGLAVVRSGHLATCGDPVVGTAHVHIKL